jgi:hypothetical protein
MKTVAEKSNTQHQLKTVATVVSPDRRVDQEALGFADHREASLSQTGWQAVVDTRPRGVAQRQRLAGIFGGPLQTKKNRTGLPENLKPGLVHLSGLALDDVSVHDNSAKPGAIGAQVAASIYRRLGGDQGLPGLTERGTK